jgi:hypothetical protein
MDFIAITIANIIWILYSMSEGIREGFYNFHKYNSKKISQFESKRVFNIQRLLVLSSTSLILFYTMGIIAFPFLLGQIFMFRYFHKIMNDATLKKLEMRRIESEQNDAEVLKRIR